MPTPRLTEDDQRPRIIDMKLPLPWLLGSAMRVRGQLTRAINKRAKEQKS